MAISFAQAQANLLATDFLDSIGVSPKQFGGETVQLNALAKTVIKSSAEFAANAKDNLNQADRVASGSLLDSIEPKVVELGVNNVVDIYVNDYYKFVDKGVKGWKDRSGSGSPYAFKAPGGSTGAKSSKMVTAIRKWLIKEGIKIRNTKKAITPREGRRLNITDTSTSAAIVIAGKIRRDGLRKTDFWTKAIRQLEQDFANDIAGALRIDVSEQVQP